MRKAILVIAIAALLVASVMAEGDKLQLGMEMRLEQLALSIQRNIDYGEQVLDVIAVDYPEAEVARMEEILGELEILIDEAEALEGGTKELSEGFTVIRLESIALSKEFKEIADGILTDEEIDAIKEDLVVDGQLQAKAQEKKNQYNAFVLQNMFRNIDVAEDIQGLAQGKLTLSQVRQSIITKYMNAGESIKAMIQTQVRENLEEHRQRPEDVDNLEQKLQNRAEDRKDLMQQMKQQNQINSGGNTDTGSDNSGGTSQGGDNGGSSGSGSSGSSGSSSSGSSSGSSGSGSSGSSGGTSGGSGGGSN